MRMAEIKRLLPFALVCILKFLPSYEEIHAFGQSCSASGNPGKPHHTRLGIYFGKSLPESIISVDY